jgi:hypothetical protein
VGKTVQFFSCCFKNDSITGKLPTQMLQTIDKLNIFNNSTGLSPFLLLDGHDSYFELAFLKYIYSLKSNLEICIRLPYGTSYRQDKNSREENGSFKMALFRSKQELAWKQCNHCSPFSREGQNIKLV